MEWNNNNDDNVFFCEWQVSEEDENDLTDNLKKEVKEEAKDASRYAKGRSRNVRKEIMDEFRD